MFPTEEQRNQVNALHQAQLFVETTGGGVLISRSPVNNAPSHIFGTGYSRVARSVSESSPDSALLAAAGSPTFGDAAAAAAAAEVAPALPIALVELDAAPRASAAAAAARSPTGVHRELVALQRIPGPQLRPRRRGKSLRECCEAVQKARRALCEVIPPLHPQLDPLCERIHHAANAVW